MVGERLTDRLESVFDGLASGVPGIQYAQYLELCELREDVHVAAVAHQFRTGRREIRPWLVRYLVDIQNERSIETLIELIRGIDDQLMRERLFDAIQQVPDKNADKVDVLVETLGDESKDINLFAIRSMGKIRTPKCVVKLVRLVASETDPEIRLAILNALEDVRDTRALKAGRFCLLDDHVDVVAQAVHLVAEMGGRRDVRQLRKMATHTSPRVRMAVCDALGRNKEISPKALMSRILSDDHEGVRAAAARALGSCQLTSVADALLTVAAEDDSLVVRKMAGFVLSSMKRAVAASVLEESLDRGSTIRRRVALEHVGLRELRRAAPGVRRLLRHKELNLRVAAAGALGRIGWLEDIDVLEGLLDDEAPLAYAAAAAICHIVDVVYLDRLATLLDSQQNLPNEILQIFARHLSHITRVHSLSLPLMIHVRRWLGLGNSNCSYLALRVLSRCGEPEDLSRLDPFLGMDLDPKVRSEARAALSAILARHVADVHRDLVEGQVPDIPGVWTRLAQIHVPIDHRSGWITALALYLKVPDRVGELFEEFVGSLALHTEPDPDEVPESMRDVITETVVHTVSSGNAESDMDIGEHAVPVGSTLEFENHDPGSMFDHEGVEARAREVSPRAWALLSAWIRRWPDALADLAKTLPDIESDRVPALLALRRTAMRRELTEGEQAVIRDGLMSDSLVMRRIVLETIPWARSAVLIDPLIELALNSDPGDERNRARYLLSRTLTGGRA